MRFLPSGCVTSGCSFAVVKVYTRPVSETTSSRTCVPVRVLSSYAFFMMPGAARVSATKRGGLERRLTSLPFRERYVASALILDKLDFNLPPACLLVGRGLPAAGVVVVVVVPAFCSVVVCDEGVVCDGLLALLRAVWGVHVEGAGALAEGGGGEVVVGEHVGGLLLLVVVWVVVLGRGTAKGHRRIGRI